jgi:hypothetical protein
MKLRYAVLAAALLAAAPADAATYLVTYTGTVKGTDPGGLFGSPGALNTTFTAVYTLYTSMAGVTEVNYDNTLRQTYGGAEYHNRSPVSGTLTIKGKTVSFGGKYMGEYMEVDGLEHPSAPYWAYEDLGNIAEDYVPASNSYNILSLSIISYAHIFVGGYAHPIDYSTASSDQRTGNFRYSDGTRSASGTLTVQHVTFALESLATPTPEPATWAMMLAGFGLVGAAMRKARQRQTVRVSFA